MPDGLIRYLADVSLAMRFLFLFLAAWLFIVSLAGANVGYRKWKRLLAVAFVFALLAALIPSEEMLLSLIEP